MKDNSELISMLSLVDDPDVGGVVKTRLMERGEEAVELIEAMRHNLPTIDSSIIDSFLLELKESITMEQLKKLLELPEPPLNKEIFLLTKLMDSECSEEQWNDVLEDFIIDISLEISSKRTDVENVEIFNHLFFSRFKFRCEDPEMRSEECALINRVFDSRKGNPVAVSLIYFMLSGSVGLPIHPMCFSGGFIPAYIDKRGEVLFYLNVFNRGAIFTKEHLKDIPGFAEMGDTEISVGQERALASIYVEMLMFVYENISYSYKKPLLEEIQILLGSDKKLL